uniref:Uncharacterized protein n=1 Tax=Aegilops tauschii subsp. strangulata TaxID=200361 RepID=A0A453RA82_AEGTS
IFKKHAHTRPDALTDKELGEMLKANRDPKDFSGRVETSICAVQRQGGISSQGDCQGGL